MNDAPKAGQRRAMPGEPRGCPNFKTRVLN
jgi:hypothetical protein